MLKKIFVFLFLVIPVATFAADKTKKEEPIEQVIGGQ